MTSRIHPGVKGGFSISDSPNGTHRVNRINEEQAGGLTLPDFTTTWTEDRGERLARAWAVWPSWIPGPVDSESLEQNPTSVVSGF